MVVRLNSSLLLSFLSLLLVSLPAAYGADTVLGVYIFSRHGDRTAKSTPPTNLTDLGYRQVYTSGSYFRDRYVSSNASSRIQGINPDVVRQSQIAVSAPQDTVLMNSAQGFLQGLYPPVGDRLGSEELRNRTVVQAPMNGYQLIPVQMVASGTGSEDSAWLQGASNCAQAAVSSDEYYDSADYTDLLASTGDFYKSLTPLVNATFRDDAISYKNAYTIFDLLNVASIHNASFPPSGTQFPSSTLSTLRTLADHHEYSLAFNASSSIRAISGSTLAAEIVQALNATITSSAPSSPKKAPKLNIQFGAYASFQSFFGLAGLTEASADFYGIPDYASGMVFELFTTGPADPFPKPEDLQVRFLFRNGTASNGSQPTLFPLFAQPRTELSWTDFAGRMNAFAVGEQGEWCRVCGNSTGVCASTASSSGTQTQGSQDGSGGGGGVSKAVAGVIGAMVTLAVVLAVEAAILLLGGLRLVSKKRLTRDGSDGVASENGRKG
ncbi:MAG: hypothetical protein Q9167_000571 [Letrouitia subvulpina]